MLLLLILMGWFLWLSLSISYTERMLRKDPHYIESWAKSHRRVHDLFKFVGLCTLCLITSLYTLNQHTLVIMAAFVACASLAVTLGKLLLKLSSVRNFVARWQFQFDLVLLPISMFIMLVYIFIFMYMLQE